MLALRAYLPLRSTLSCLYRLLPLRYPKTASCLRLRNPCTPPFPDHGAGHRRLSTRSHSRQGLAHLATGFCTLAPRHLCFRKQTLRAATYSPVSKLQTRQYPSTMSHFQVRRRHQQPHQLFPPLLQSIACPCQLQHTLEVCRRRLRLSGHDHHQSRHLVPSRTAQTQKRRQWKESESTLRRGWSAWRS